MIMTALPSIQPGDDGGVVAEAAVPVQLVEALADALDVVERIGALGMPRQLGPLPVRQVREEVGLQLVELLLQLLPLPGLGRVHLHGSDLGLQFEHWLFQLGEIHGLFGGVVFHETSRREVQRFSVQCRGGS
jgi:hypothetical protein